MLSARGILYLPDFLVNRMGIVNCANEQYGYVDNDSGLTRHLDYSWEYSVYQTSLRVLHRAQQKSTHPHQAAVQTAEELSRVSHPIWGHRSQEIITNLSDLSNAETSWISH